MSRVHVSRIIHTIHSTTDIYGCRLRYQDALGGLVFAENYFPAEDRDCALLYVTNHMVEPMAPRTPGDMTKPYARMAAKIGQAFHSFELKVENGKEASQIFRDGGAKTASDYGIFFFVKAESTGGVLLEVCETPMPNDPYDRPHWDPRVGQGHHASVLSLDHIACVTADADAAIRFFTGFVDGEIVSDERVSQPQPARRVVIHIGDTDVAFVQPDDPAGGPLGAFLAKPQNGIYALVWAVADPAKARSHFADKLNLRLTGEACISAGFAIEPEDFFGARHEFVGQRF
ncbi:MAG: lactoylglutathione lyase [Sphingomonadales bacterium]|nr:lactoylglutathione lyase [Sphingomonadales bacterium]